MVGAVFGKKALQAAEPFGMKRMSDEAYNEQSVATTTEFAVPVPGDSPEVALFRPLLAKTRLETKPLRLAYSAEKDGWNARAFHAAVNAYGAAVVLGKTAGGAIFGGYNPRGWIGLGEDRNAMSAFLFTFPAGDTSRPAEKLVKVGGAGLAVIDKAESGPLFGAEGLSIPLQQGQERVGKSRLGSYYARRADGGRTLFAVGEEKRAQLVDLKVFVAAGGPEEWQLDGIVWKSSGS
ncbi:g2735 [Coccomyxa elongata]